MNKVFKRLMGFALAGVLGLSLASCGGDSEGEKPNPDNEPEVIDYASQLKLEHDYEGKDFVIDGIGEVHLFHCFDGDTISTNAGTIRFLAIDTPESTGKVEAWGKTASKYTEAALTSAKKIVLEAANVGSRPTQDSSGGRWLGYVWYIPKDGTELKNLNLELAQMGYSEYQFTTKYKEYFDGAYEQAQRLQLGVYDPKGDPNFMTDIVDTDIKTILEELAANPEETLGKKIRLEVYIKDSPRKNTYTIAQVIEGVEYTMPLYVGYSAGEFYTTIGNKINLVAYVGEHYGDYQISGPVTATTNKPGTFTELIQSGYYVQVGTKNLENFQIKKHHLYDDMTVEAVTESNGMLTITGKAKRRGKDVRNLTVNVPVTANDKKNIQVGSKIAFKGYTKTDTTGDTMDVTVEVLSLKDIKVQ